MNRVRPKLIAITGGSGAGKSWLAERLTRLLDGHAERVSLDSFYIDRSHLPPGRRAVINFDHPRGIDWRLATEVLRSLKEGRGVVVPRYDFSFHSRLAERDTVRPAAAIIVEGLWLLHKPAVRKMFDLRIFIRCPARLRLKRRVDRDTVLRGRTEEAVRRQFHNSVAPMHARFVEPQRAKADLVMNQPMDDRQAILLADHLWELFCNETIRPEAQREIFQEKAVAILRRTES